MIPADGGFAREASQNDHAGNYPLWHFGSVTYNIRFNPNKNPLPGKGFTIIFISI
jgi:hypothetical protein